MALTKDLIKQMQNLAAFSPEELDSMLQTLASTDADAWRQSVNLIILTLWTEHSATRRGVRSVGRNLKEFQDTLMAAVAGGPPAEEAVEAPTAPPSMQSAAVVGGSNETLYGADGSPITDAAQIEAEQLMNSVVGPPGQTAPAPKPQQRRGGRSPGRGQAPAAPASPIIGADGSVITDPQQIEAERLMNEVLGT